MAKGNKTTHGIGTDQGGRSKAPRKRMAEEGKERARRAPQKDRRSCPAATGRNQGGCENPPYSYWILVSTRSAAALVSTAGYRNNAQTGTPFGMAAPGTSLASPPCNTVWYAAASMRSTGKSSGSLVCFTRCRTLS